MKELDDLYKTLNKLNEKYSDKNFPSDRKIRKQCKILKKNIKFRISHANLVINSLSKAFIKIKKTMSKYPVFNKESQSLNNSQKKDLGIEK